MVSIKKIMKKLLQKLRISKSATKLSDIHDIKEPEPRRKEINEMRSDRPMSPVTI